MLVFVIENERKNMYIEVAELMDEPQIPTLAEFTLLPNMLVWVTPNEPRKTIMAPARLTAVF